MNQERLQAPASVVSSFVVNYFASVFGRKTNAVIVFNRNRATATPFRIAPHWRASDEFALHSVNLVHPVKRAVSLICFPGLNPVAHPVSISIPNGHRGHGLAPKALLARAPCQRRKGVNGRQPRNSPSPPSCESCSSCQKGCFLNLFSRLESGRILSRALFRMDTWAWREYKNKDPR